MRVDVIEIANESVIYLPCAWNFLNGSTMAKYRSPESAVSVKTETPIDTSLINSDNMQRKLPHGHESTV